MTPEHTHVVVVNDNPDFLAVMEELLQVERYRATTIDGDRADAVSRIRAAEPDVLVIDLRLGHDGPHGWDVVREVRADRQLSQLPTLVCSTDINALAEIEREIRGMPTVDTLAKPFSIAELMSKLDALAGAPSA